jgi:exopolysaccharide production protein ExoQ
MVGLHFDIWMKRPAVTFVLLLALAAELNAIVMSQSAGAMIAAFAGCMVMALLLVMGRVGPVGRAWLLIMLFLTALLALTIYTVAGDALMQTMMALFKKDPTLTGRQYLWARSEDIIAGHTMLGLGYSAFWVEGNIDAEGLLTWARIPARTGFNFHNTVIANLVEVGYVGLIVLEIAVAIGTVGLLIRCLRYGEKTVACWLAILAYEFSRVPFEALGPLPFYHTTVLVWVALGMAWPVYKNALAERPRYD